MDVDFRGRPKTGTRATTPSALFLADRILLSSDGHLFVDVLQTYSRECRESISLTQSPQPSWAD